MSGQNMHNYDNSEKSVDVQASQWCCPHSRDTTATTLSAETCPCAVIYIFSTVLSHFPFSEEQENYEFIFKDENYTLRTRLPTQWLKKIHWCHCLER